MATQSKDGIFKPRHFADLSDVTSLHLHFSLFTSKEPKGFKSALKDPKLFAAMCHEMITLQLNSTWDLVPRPPRSNMFCPKWVFRTKFHADGSFGKFKSRVVAQGYTQVVRLDYFATFSPVVKASTVHIIVSLDILHKWPLHQLDVKNTYLNGHLSDTTYIEQPPWLGDS